MRRVCFSCLVATKSTGRTRIAWSSDTCRTVICFPTRGRSCGPSATGGASGTSCAVTQTSAIKSIAGCAFGTLIIHTVNTVGAFRTWRKQKMSCPWLTVVAGGTCVAAVSLVPSTFFDAKSALRAQCLNSIPAVASTRAGQFLSKESSFFRAEETSPAGSACCFTPVGVSFLWAHFHAIAGGVNLHAWRNRCTVS